MTLGMNAVLAGCTLVFTNGTPQGEAPQFARDLAVERIGGVRALGARVLGTLQRRAGLPLAAHDLRQAAVRHRQQRQGVVSLRRAGAPRAGPPPIRSAGSVLAWAASCSRGTRSRVTSAWARPTCCPPSRRLSWVAPRTWAVRAATSAPSPGPSPSCLLQNVLQIGIKPAGQQILYGLIILLMLFVYGRNARVRE